MFDRPTVLKLAALARIAIPTEEQESLARDLETIVGYVSAVTAVSAQEGASAKPALHNRMRQDGEPHEGGAYSERLLAQAPATLRGYLKVKKIIAQD